MADDPRKRHPEFTATDPPTRGKKMQGVVIPPLKKPPPEPEAEPEPPTPAPEPSIQTAQTDVQIFQDRVTRSIPPSVRHPSRGVKVALSSGAFLTLAMGLWQGLPPVLESLKSNGAPTSTPSAQCATQAAHDALAARVHQQTEQIRRLAEWACDANQGAPMLDFPCASAGEYETPMNPPPLRRTPRVFPK